MAEQTTIPLGDGHADLARLEVVRGRSRERLTAREARLLAYLAARPGRAVSREELLVEVWDYAPGVVSRTLDTTVRRLRRKIEVDPSEPELILADYGVGYRFAPPRPSPPRAVARLGARGETLDRPDLERRVADALAAHRLVTLWGPGGIGKSTLAEVVIGELDRPVLRVALADVDTPDALLTRVAAALSVGVATPAIRNALRTRDVVLVLDEAERVIDPLADLLDDALDGAGGATLLVTSRTRLDLGAEVVVPVPAFTPEQAREVFRHHARRIGASDAEDPSIDALVDALDGLPLAVALAASRSLVASPAQQLARLRADQSPIGAGSHLRTSILHHLDTLGPTVRDLAHALTVFRGWYTAEDVAQVVGPDATAVLAELVDASLIQRADGGWLRMLTTIRAVVREARAPSEDVVRAHEAWIIARLQAMNDDFLGMHPRRAVDTCLRLLPDALAVFDRAVEAGRGEVAGAVARTVNPTVEACAPLSLRRHLEQSCLDLGERVPLEDRLVIQVRRAFSLARVDRDPSALTLSRDALAQVDRLEARVGVIIRTNHGRVARMFREFEASEAVLREAIAALEGDHSGTAIADRALALGQLALTLHGSDPSRSEEALALLREAVQLAETRNVLLNAGSHNDIARILLETGRTEEATRILRRGARLAQEGGERRMEGSMRANLGHMLLDEDPEEARQQLDRALRLMRQLDQPYVTAIVLGNLAWVDLSAGRPEDAAAHADEASRTVGRPWHRGMYATLAALAHARAGHVEQARDRLDEAAAQAELAPTGQDVLRWLIELVRAVVDGSPLPEEGDVLADETPHVRMIARRFQAHAHSAGH